MFSILFLSIGLAIQSLFLLSSFPRSINASSVFQSTNATDWKITIASKEEPGERMMVSGTVYDADGKTPIEGATVYVYQTGKDGLYNHTDGSSRNLRIKGWMRTNTQGKYEYRTIKPGSYPNSRIAAHVHYVVSAPGYSERKLELVFEGDPFLTSRMKRDTKSDFGFFNIRKLEKNEEGLLVCTLDIRLKKE